MASFTLQAGEDFHRFLSVADRDRHKLDAAAASHPRNPSERNSSVLDGMVTECGRPVSEVNEEICAGLLVARVVDVHFDIQSARRLVDHIGVAHDGSGEDLPRVRVLCEGDAGSIPHNRGIGFRH